MVRPRYRISDDGSAQVPVTAVLRACTGTNSGSLYYHAGLISGMSKKTKEQAGPKPLLASDPERQTGRLQHLCGSKNDDFNNATANQLLNALWLPEDTPEDTRHGQFRAALGALSGIAPRDEIEGMLASQMVACHHAAMECYRRAMIGEQPFTARAQNLNAANKLGRTYAALLEALNRHRGKGQQTVRVEHVHVHDGGQAIVGAVNHSRGVGGAPKTRKQPHAKQTGDA